MLLAEASELATVDKTAGYVPVHLLGRLTWPSMRGSEEVAIAVNGRIAAVTTSYQSVGDTWFSALIDEAVLRNGQNSVEVFAVRGNRPTTRLVHLGGTGSTTTDASAAG